MLHPGLLRQPGQSQRRSRVHRNRLLAIHMFASGNRGLYALRAQPRKLRVKIDGVVRVLQRRRQVRSPSRNTMRCRNLRQLCLIPPHQNRIRHQHRPILQPQPSSLAYLKNRSDQVLIQPHPSCHAVHDDAYSPGCHQPPSPTRFYATRIISRPHPTAAPEHRAGYFP